MLWMLAETPDQLCRHHDRGGACLALNFFAAQTLAGRGFVSSFAAAEFARTVPGIVSHRFVIASVRPDGRRAGDCDPFHRGA
jgi:hypothetical protein